LQERFDALEKKFAALESRHDDLHKRVFTVTENSTGKITEFAEV
jgi:hypothetical protein